MNFTSHPSLNATVYSDIAINNHDFNFIIASKELLTAMAVVPHASDVVPFAKFKHKFELPCPFKSEVYYIPERFK